MKWRLLFLLFTVLLFSCEENEFSGSTYRGISFDVSEWVMKGENSTCIDFDSDGNAWIGSGSTLIFYDGNTIGLSTNPEKGHWFEFRVNTVSYIFSGWHFADRGITQAYYCFRMVTDGKATLYAGIGAGVPLLSDRIGWASVNIPFGIQVNPFNQLRGLFLTAEYNPMVGVANEFEITNTLSVGFRYLFGKKK